MQIIKKEAKRITVVTANGTELVCIPVRTLPIQNLMFQIGLSSEVLKTEDPAVITAALRKGTAAQRLDATKASMALFNYCMAYGVETDPPPEAAEELRSLNLSPNTKAALRATWLNFLVLEDIDEAALLAGVIMAVTSGRTISLEDNKIQTEKPEQ